MTKFIRKRQFAETVNTSLKNPGQKWFFKYFCFALLWSERKRWNRINENNNKMLNLSMLGSAARPSGHLLIWFSFMRINGWGIFGDSVASFINCFSGYTDSGYLFYFLIFVTCLPVKKKLNKIFGSMNELKRFGPVFWVKTLQSIDCYIFGE